MIFEPAREGLITLTEKPSPRLACWGFISEATLGCIMVNLAWIEAMAAYRGLFNGARKNAGWPETMTPKELAGFMEDPVNGDGFKDIAWLERAKFITSQCESGQIEHSTIEVIRKKCVDMPVTFSSLRWDDESDNTKVQYIDVKEIQYHVTPDAFLKWLKNQGFAPSKNIQLWKDVICPDQAKKGHKTESGYCKENLSSNKKLNWRDLTEEYIRSIYAPGKYSSAKEMYNALLINSNGYGSPFIQGTGINKGVLFVRETNQPVALPTFAKLWTLLKNNK